MESRKNREPVQDTAAKVALLLTSSASCLRRRQYPFKLFNKDETTPSGTFGDNDTVGKKRKSAKLEDDIETDIAQSSSSSNQRMLLGHSSENPLRIRNNAILKRGKLRINHFIGDRQPITAVHMAHLFGAHPTPHIGIMPSIPTSQIGEKNNSNNEHPIILESTQEDVIIQEPVLPENQSNNNSTDSNTTRIYNLAKPRYIYEQLDEPIPYAGVDVELPSSDLLEFLRNLASHKIIKYETRNSESMNQETSESVLINKFDDTALIAIGVILEELIRDMMLKWYKSGSPLGFEPRTLRTEALVQMNSSSSNPNNISTDILQNILEALFCRDLSEQRDNIELFRKVAITRYAPTPVTK